MFVQLREKWGETYSEKSHMIGPGILYLEGIKVTFQGEGE